MKILILVLIFINVFCQMPKDARIFVAGHKGLVGSGICRILKSHGYNNLILKTHSELDLENEAEVNNFFAKLRPEYVFLSAARVGGILANNFFPVDFLVNNLKIELNVISSAYKYGVKKLLFLGSSCIYPKFCPQPIKEQYLLTGELERTNEWYAIAKIAGIKMCQAYNKQYNTNFIACMPTNLYGIEDNFSPMGSHVIPGLMRRIHDAKIENHPQVIIWGTGNPRREFLYIDDLAEALLLLMNNYEGSEIINIGSGADMTIRELANSLAKVIGYKGELVFDTSKPDGTPQKLLDISKLILLGWEPQIKFLDGLKISYEWFLQNINNLSLK
jgi:GDP-L-fucose synthase